MRNERIVQKMNELKLHYQDEKYWNHAVGTPNDYRSVTDNPCTHHGTGNTGHSYSGSCGCNSFPNGVGGSSRKAIQCHGFALCMAYEVFGNYPDVGGSVHPDCDGSDTYTTLTNGAKRWKVYGANHLNGIELEPGDIVRSNLEHSAIVWEVFDDGTATFAQVYGSPPYNCEIAWNGFNSKNRSSQAAVINAANYIAKAPTTVNVHFENFGGEMPSDQSLDVELEMDGTFSDLPTPTREGYTFKGWYRDPVSELRKVENGDDVDSIRDMTLYAHWQKKCYLTQDNKYLYVPGPLESLYNGKELKTISNKAIVRAQWFVENMGSDYILRSVVNPAMAVGQMCYGECKACKILYPEPDLDACRVMLMEWDDNCTYCTIRLAEENLFLTRHSGGDLCWEERSPGRSQIWKLTDVVDS